MIKAADIIIDDFIYPRNQKDNQNIKVLFEKLMAGTVLDSIEVQRVSGYGDNGEDAILLIDGGHRLDAYQEFNTFAKDSPLLGIEECLPTFKWHKDEVLDYEACKTELLIHAHNVNDDKGLNSRQQDTKKAARNLKQANPDWTASRIGTELGRDRSTISPYIQDIVQQERANEKRIAVRLSQLGWTQTEIGEVVGKDQSVVSRIMQNVDANILHTSFSEGKTIHEISSFSDLDIQTVWSILLQDKSDKERIDELGISLRPYDVWNFAGCHELCGVEYPGRVPGQIVANVLYFYTQQGDLVIDPMAGGGTTMDACLLMNRHCYGYDISPTEKRSDILQHNLSESPPPKLEKADLLFLDPPYFKKKEKEYPDGSISELSKPEYLEFFADMFSNAYQVMKEGSLLALLMSNYDDTGDLAERRIARRCQSEG